MVWTLPRSQDDSKVHTWPHTVHKSQNHRPVPGYGFAFQGWAYTAHDRRPIRPNIPEELRPHGVESM